MLVFGRSHPQAKSLFISWLTNCDVQRLVVTNCKQTLREKCTASRIYSSGTVTRHNCRSCQSWFLEELPQRSVESLLLRLTLSSQMQQRYVKAEVKHGRWRPRWGNPSQMYHAGNWNLKAMTAMQHFCKSSARAQRVRQDKQLNGAGVSC